MIELVKLNAEYHLEKKENKNTVSVNKPNFSDTLTDAVTAAKNTEKTDYDSIFEQASKEYGVPVALLKAVAKAESSYQKNVVSTSGAMGIMQLMPATAKAMGVSNAFDPEDNIMGGAKYLSMMLDRYDGDVSLALAAYNAGPGNVDKYDGIPPFEETQNYVVKVEKYMNENQGKSSSIAETSAYMKAKSTMRIVG